MPNGYTPETQFQQYVVDKFEHQTTMLKSISEEKLPERVQALEADAKWYKRIFGVIYSAVGAVIVVVIDVFRKG